MDYHIQKDYKVISQKLPIFSALFLFVIIMGFVTLKEPKIKYVMDIEQAWQDAVTDKSAVRPERVYEILNSTDSAYYRFIDIRTPHDFLNGHIPGAINIPIHQILNDDVKNVLRQDEKINIIYGNHHREACAPYLLLKQIGYKNNSIMLGGFTFFEKYVLDAYKPNADNCLDEKAIFDYKKIMNSAKSTGSNTNTSETPKTEAPVKKKKKVAEEEGGC